MDPIAVDVRLIKAVLGTELRLTPGRALMARGVATDAAGQRDRRRRWCCRRLV